LRPRSRKVFSAAFVTSLTVAQSIGMTVPAAKTGEESSTARAVLTSSTPPTAVVLPDIPEQSAGHHPPGGVREGEVLPGDASRA